jgi:ketosteroid isomerase-like protein
MKKLWAVPVLLMACTPGCGRVDQEAEQAAIREADQAWSETPPDLDRFMSYFTEGATAMAPEAPILTGRSAIRSFWSGLFANPGFSLTWKVSDARVSPRGGLGYSIGTFELNLEDSAGEAVNRTGKYLTVWEKQEDGQWKVVADTLTLDSPPAPSS